MTNNKFHLYYCFVVICLTLLVYLMSFFISVAGGNVQNLLSEEGLRWTISESGQIISKNNQMLFRSIAIITIFDSIIESGLLKHVIKLIKGDNKVVHRERVALFTTQLFIFLSYTTLYILIILPHSPILSIKGDLSGSAIQQGYLPLISIIMITAGILYGKIAGTFRTAEEIGSKVTVTIKRNSFYFITYLFLTWFVESLYKSEIIYLTNSPIMLIRSIIWSIYSIPVIYSIVKRC